MTTITWHRGETRKIGIPADGIDAAQMRIGAPPVCILIAGAAQDVVDATGTTVPGFVFRLDDGTLADVRNGLSRVSIWSQSAGEWSCRDTSHNLNVMEGC